MMTEPQGKPELLGGVVDPELLRYWRTFAKPSNEVLACDLIEALLHKLSALESVRSEADTGLFAAGRVLGFTMGIEEAAKVAEQYDPHTGSPGYDKAITSSIAASIRALQSSEDVHSTELRK